MSLKGARGLLSMQNLRRRGKQSRQRRRSLGYFERLEARALLATITFGNSAGGSWTQGSNWVGGVVPGVNDDVVIPDFPGTPTITISTGIVNVKNLEIREALVLSGGSLTSTSIQQLGGSFTVSGGTIKDTTLTQGTAVVTNQVSIQNLTVATGATLTVQGTGRLSIDEVSALTVSGTANFQSGARVDFKHNTSVGFSEIVVNSGGIVNAATTDFTRSGAWSTKTRITVNDGGRLVASNSNFQIENVILGSNVVFNAGDWLGNRFSRPIYIPHKVAPLLSAAGGGADNLAFNEIHLLSSTVTSGTLDLRGVGTETTANLSYWFDTAFDISAGATLNLFPAVKAFISNASTLSVSGNMNLQNGSSLTFQQEGFGPFAELVVNGGGVLNTNNASLLRGGSVPSRTRVTVNDGGRLIAINSTFTIEETRLSDGVVFNAGDWSSSRFDRPIYVPHKVIPFLSSAGGGADNARFSQIFINAGTLASGTLDLRSIGTETTANLSYWFAGAFTISSGATLNVFPSVKAFINNAIAVTVSGNMNLQNGSTLTFQQEGFGPFAELIVNSGGVLNANNASLLRGGSVPSRTRVTVNDGGRLIATNSTFTIEETRLSDGVVFNAGDWSSSRFDRPIYVPHKVIPFLSTAGGGADNARFSQIFINAGTLASGTLDLRSIGTETTANLSYWFAGAFTISSGATLNVFPTVKAFINNAIAVSVSGNMSLQNGSSLTFQQEGFGPFAELIVNSGGVLNANNASLLRGGSVPSRTRVTVNDGGRLIATNSTFTIEETRLSDGVVFKAGDWSSSRFDRPIYVPHKVIPFFSSAGGGADNARFSQIFINAGTLASGTLDLRSIGTETAANLSYWFAGAFTISSGATLNVLPTVKAFINNAIAVSVSGNMSLQNGSSLTFQQEGFGPFAELIVNSGGVLNANNASLLRGGSVPSRTRVTVNDGGRLITTNSTFTIEETRLSDGVVFNAGDWSSSRFDRPIYVPHKVIPFLSSAGGGADNARFNQIFINAGTLASGTLDLRSIGTETTANLSYWFAGAFTISSGATLNVFPSVKAFINNAIAVTVSGNMSLQNGSTLTFQQEGFGPFAELIVNSGGVVNANNASLLRGGSVPSRTRVTVNDGGRLITTNSMFTIEETRLSDGVVFNAGDWSSSRFDRPIYVPHKVIPLLSSAGGGADNARFSQIFINAGTLASGTLDLRLIGTETTANLSYWFAGAFTISSGATLNVLPTVKAFINNAIAVTVSGNMSLQNGSSLTFQQEGFGPFAELVVNSGGVLNANNASLLRGGSVPSRTQFTVSSGGRFDAADTDIQPWIFNVASGAIVNLSVKDASTKTVGQGGIDQVLANVKSVEIGFGSTLNLLQTLQVGASPSDVVSLNVSYSSTLAITGSLLGKTQSVANFLPHGRVLFNGSGNSSKPQLLEVMGRDLGAVSAGFSPTNFVYGKIELANNTYVRLTNIDLNSAVNEAIYVHTLVVPSGSTLDLNNQKIYVRSAQYAAGAIVNGTIAVDPTIVADGGPILFSLPTPGEISSTQQLANQPDEWTFTAPKNGPVMIQVNPGATGTTGAVTPQIQRVTVELLDNSNVVIKSGSNIANGAILTLVSDPLTLGGQYKIRVRPFSTETGKYVITVVNDDARETGLSLSVAAGSEAQTEGTSGTVTYNFFVTRFGDVSGATTVDWSVVGSGTNPVDASDFPGGIFPSGTISFAASEAVKPITIQIASDAVFEPDESFAFRLVRPSIGAAIILGEVTSVVRNDDQPQSPDLVVSAIATPNDPHAGESITLGWTEKNQGTVTVTGSWSTRVIVTKASNSQVIYDQVHTFNNNDLAAQGTIDRTIQFSLPLGGSGAGVFNVSIEVDSAKSIVEQNLSLNAESNNTTTTSFLSTETGSPDLSVSQITAPNTAQLSIPLNINWTVLNSGTASLTKVIQDRVYLSSDNVLDVGDLSLTSVDASAKIPLDVNASYSQSTSITLPLSTNLGPGQFFLIVQSDFNNGQVELNEANNTRAIPITIELPPLADLIVESISTKEQTVAGQSVNLTWTVKNQGNASASAPWTDRVYLSQDGVIGGDILVQDFSFAGSIAGGQAVTRTQSVQIPSGISGTFRFVVHTDFNDFVEEFNQENNNVAIDDVGLNIDPTPSANLVVDAVNGLTQNLFTDQQATIQWVVKNIGNAAPSTNLWMDKVYLSSDSILDGSDIELGQTANATFLQAGGSYSSQITVTLPRDVVGNHFFIVLTDAGSQVLETGAEDDNARASASSNIRLTPPPDLKVISVASPEEAFEGETINVSWVIRNQGTGPTRVTSWQDQIYLSLNGNDIDPQDRLLDTVGHTGILAVNSEYQVLNYSVLIPPNIVSENAYIIVRTDSSRSVYEHDFEGNNDLPVENPIKIFRRPLPDLEVTSISPIATAFAGQPITIAYNVTNASVIPTSSAGWQESIYLSVDPILNAQTDLLLGNRARTGVLAGNASQSRSETFRLTDTLQGNYYIIVTIDSQNAIAELDEANNALAASNVTTVTIDPPDLAVTSIVTSANLKAGRSATIDYSVKNIGNNPTPNTSWTDSIFLSVDGNLDAGDRLIDARTRNGVLASGLTESRSVPLVLPKDWVGSGFLIVSSDSSNIVYELNNSNNLTSLPITITADRPDLTVPVLTTFISSQGIQPGASFALDFVVQNQGIGSTYSDPWTVSLIMSSDLSVGNGDDRTLASYTTSNALAVGDRFFRSGENIPIPANTPEGLYRLFLVADATGSVIEIDETNNARVSQDFALRNSLPPEPDLPDLQITSLALPQSATSGASLPISWTVRNQGKLPTAGYSWNDTVWLSTDASIDSADINIGTYTRFGTLGVNESYTRNINWPIAIDLSGSYFIIVQTDASGHVEEGLGELNNKRASSQPTVITLSPTPDLQVTSITTPGSANSGRDVTIAWQVSNSGGSPAVAPWSDRLYLSLDQIFDPATDIAFGYLDRIQNLAAGQTSNNSSSFALPAALNGDYYVIIETDATDRVYERQAEANNVFVSTSRMTITPLPPGDLVVDNISIPANGISGELATISYRVTNAGANSAIRSWVDSVYLSADDVWDINDALVGRFTRDQDLNPNSSYTANLSVALPGVLRGNYKAIVRADILNNVPEINEANNAQASSAVIAMDTASLQLGTPRAGTLQDNQPVYYRVDVPREETLVIEIASSAASGAFELYSSLSSVPLRSSAMFTSLQPDQTSQRIVVDSTAAGTYYVMAYGVNLSGGSAPYSILARTVPFTVFDKSFGQGGTAGERTILINGAKFDRSVTASLVDARNKTHDAIRYTRVGPTKLYATFDLKSIAEGMYAVNVTKATTSETVTINNGLEVVSAPVSLQPVTLTRPESFNRRRDARAPAPIPVAVAWRNNTLNDIAVPWIHFSATDPFSTSLEGAVAGQTTVSLEFLGYSDTDEPRDILLPGEFASRTFYVKPRQVSASDPPQDIHYVAEYFYEDLNAAYLWDFDLSQLDLSYLTDAEAIAEIQAFKTAIGNNVGALRDALAIALRRSGVQTPDEISAASRLVYQDFFDRFVAGRKTSLVGQLSSPDFRISYQGLVVTITDTVSNRSQSTLALTDGSFVFPKLTPANYTIAVSGGTAKVKAGSQWTVASGEHVLATVLLEADALTAAAPTNPLIPTGISPIAAPFITVPGAVYQELTGNVLDSVSTKLVGMNFRVELIGDKPDGFSLDRFGNFRFQSLTNDAFVVHYDLVIPDTVTRAGSLFNSEIRSRGAVAITLKNNFTRDVRSLDPNDIIGPVGFGEQQWISASERLPYTIRFENDPKNATAAAHTVQIEQILDSDLDIRTFEFGEFAFGGHTFEVPAGRQSINQELDVRDTLGIFVRVFARLDPATRKVTWTFTSVSPSTGQPTSNPSDGFLKLNLTPPEGDGFVSYSVRAKSSATTGVRIDAAARIIFDGNQPIDTPPIFNTLDVTTPSSVVTSVKPGSTNAKWLVSWSGDDGEIGSGLGMFDVFVSENGGRFRRWISTSDSQAEYSGSANVQYAFLTIARDNVGNEEQGVKISDPEVVAPSVPTLAPQSDVGESSTDGRTSISRPRFNGTGTPGYSIVVYANGVAVAEGVVAANGTYSVQSSQAITDGTYSITADQANAFGERGPISPAMSNALTIDTQRPKGTLGAVTPVIRNTGFDSLSIDFDEAVSGVTVGAFTLQLNGGPNLLGSSQQVSTSNGGTQWSLSQLSNLLTTSGTYTLTLLPSGLRDIAGNSLLDQAPSDGRHRLSFTLVLHRPTDVTHTPSNLAETNAITESDTLFGTLQAIDADTVDSIEFALVSGSGDADNDRFVIAGNQLLIKQGQLLDFESQSTYRVRVQATDSIGNMFAKELSLALVDVQEPPELTLTLASASLNEATGSTTATVKRNAPFNVPLVVTLSTNIPGQLNIPATVAIPTGSATATFSVSAVNNFIVDGNRQVSITASASGLTSSQTLTVINDDLVAPGLIVQQSDAETRVSELGTTDTIRVSLAAKPSLNVVVRFLVSDGEEIQSDINEIVFSPTNWYTPRTVTFRGIADLIDDQDRDVTIKLEVDNGRSAPEYAGVRDELIAIAEDVLAQDFRIGLVSGQITVREVKDDRLLKQLSLSGEKIIVTGSLSDKITIDAFTVSNGLLQVSSGDGNDEFFVSQLNFAKLNGGAGFDSFHWRSASPLPLRSLPDQALVSIESIDLGAGSDLLIASPTDLARVFGGTTQLVVKLEPQNDVLLGGNWATDPPIFEGGEAYHSLRREGLSLKLQTGKIWTNPLNPYDVDRNGVVQPVDAVIQINYLNRFGVKDLPVPQNASELPDAYVDASGNGQADPIDALLVINFLNQQLLGASSEPDDRQFLTISRSLGNEQPQLVEDVLPRLPIDGSQQTSVEFVNRITANVIESTSQFNEDEVDELFNDNMEFWQ